MVVPDRSGLFPTVYVIFPAVFKHITRAFRRRQTILAGRQSLPGIQPNWGIFIQQSLTEPNLATNALIP